MYCKEQARNETWYLTYRIHFGIYLPDNIVTRLRIPIERAAHHHSTDSKLLEIAEDFKQILPAKDIGGSNITYGHSPIKCALLSQKGFDLKTKTRTTKRYPPQRMGRLNSSSTGKVLTEFQSCYKDLVLTPVSQRQKNLLFCLMPVSSEMISTIQEYHPTSTFSHSSSRIATIPMV